MSSVLNFNVVKNTLELVDGAEPVSSELNYSDLVCHFIDDEWDDISLLSAGFFVHEDEVYQKAGNIIRTTVNEEIKRTATFSIPSQLVGNQNPIYFGLCGSVKVNDQIVKTISTNIVAINIRRGVLITDLSEDAADEASIYEQLLAALNTGLATKADSEDVYSKTATNDLLAAKADSDHTHSQYLTDHQDISGKEDKSNKVTSMSGNSTDTQYPSAKAVYEAVSAKADSEDVYSKTEIDDFLAEIEESAPDQSIIQRVEKIYTPEMFGAKGDGETNDLAAIRTMFNSVPNNALCVFYKNYKIEPITENNVKDCDGITISRPVNVTMYGNIIVSNEMNFGIRVSGHDVRRNKFRVNLEAEAYESQWGLKRYTASSAVSSANTIFVNETISNANISAYVGKYLIVGETRTEIISCTSNSITVADNVSCESGDYVAVYDENKNYHTIGLDLYDTWENEFDISLKNFNIGIRLISSEADCTYNKVFIRYVYDCKTAILLTGDPNTSGFTTAQNTFIGGRIGANGSSYLRLDNADPDDCYYPMKSERVGGRTNNNNNFISVSFEGFKVSSNVTAYQNRVKIKADMNFGSLIGCRYENVTEFYGNHYVTVVSGYAFSSISNKLGSYTAIGVDESRLFTFNDSVKLRKVGGSGDIVEAFTANVDPEKETPYRIWRLNNDGYSYNGGIKVTQNGKSLTNGGDAYIRLRGSNHSNPQSAFTDTNAGSKMVERDWAFSDKGFILNKNSSGTGYVIQPIYSSQISNPYTGTMALVSGKPMWYNGSAWVYANGDPIFDYQTPIDSSSKLSSDFVDDTNKTNKFVTDSDKTTWNAKYDKPSGGIPSTDLSSAVQSSLDKADQYTGTITGITMNGASKGTSGVIDLGTVITSHQSLNGVVPKTTTIAGVDLQDDISAAELKNALSVPTKASELTNDSKYIPLVDVVSLASCTDNGVLYRVTESDDTYLILNNKPEAVVGATWTQFRFRDDGISYRISEYSNGDWGAFDSFGLFEDCFNKASSITNDNKTSIEAYPTIKAVVDYIAAQGFLTSHQDISGKADKATTLSGYGITDAQSKIDSSHKLSSDLVDDTNNNNKFVTAAEKTGWSGKYNKPSGGIPSTDLDSAVQTSLGKADTALQSYTEQYTGTITGITMNGVNKGTSGVIDLGTVITSHQSLAGLEVTSNKVTSLSSNSTDNQYPSAKCVYDLIGNIESLLSQV